MDAQMDTQKQLLASSELLQNHPELKWEQVADQDTLPKLGVAQSLYVKDRRLSDFRCESVAAAVVMSVHVSAAWRQSLAVA